MIHAKRLAGTLVLLSASLLGACATASSPWAQHEEKAGWKAALMKPNAVCPVVVQNYTETTLDASYEVVGMTFDLGLLPSGQSAEFKVQCQAGRVRATAVSHAMGVGEPQHHFQKMVRLELSSVTRLQLTQADMVY